MKGVILTPLRRINTPGGDVLHGMKNGDAGFHGFGEVYFSVVTAGAIKGWKRHRDMTLNLLVPAGKVRFVLFEEPLDTDSKGTYEEFTLCSESRYSRLTVPPGLWMAFQGLSAGLNLVANVANLSHDPREVDRKALQELDYHWT
jgi:dTDP-4-dehydrorhamnose 3,5-epimerase